VDRVSTVEVMRIGWRFTPRDLDDRAGPLVLHRAPSQKQGSKMSPSNLNHRPPADPSRAKVRSEMMMPRLTRSQMLAILCESGVPEGEARRWIERDATLHPQLSPDDT
jgi:hypothetical protein